jgi:hypothetical protein
MNRIAALIAALAAAVTVVVFGAALSASAATVPVPGIGAALWGTPSDRLTVAPGTSRTIWTAFYSTGPAETAALSVGTVGTGTGAGFAAAAAGYISLSTATVSLPAKPAAPITLIHVPNGVGGYENVTTSSAYVFVAVTITVPAGAPAFTFATGDAYETLTGQVQVHPAAGITTSPGVGLAIALSTR